MKKLIYIIDDEEDIIELQEIHLVKSGFDVCSFIDGNSFLKKLDSKMPNLILLDLMLPDIDGLEICKILKSDEKYKDIPVIMVTAKGDTIDKVVGLELGADDYLTKPFSPKELVARVKAVLRRCVGKENKGQDIFNNDLLRIIYDEYTVLVDNKKIDLTNKEFKILELLTRNINKVFTREKILNYVWGDESFVIDRTVDVHVRHLRKKLGIASYMIKNIRSAGYKFENKK